MAYPYNLGDIMIMMGYQPSDFEIKDDQDGNGPYFVSFSGSPIPTEADINTFYTNYLAHPDRLVEYKTKAKEAIDYMAEVVRLKYVTPGSAQAMTYQEKGEEAADYVAASYPADLSSYPFIQAEINATGKTKEAAADDILAQKAAWIAVGASIEEERLSGKKAVDDATDESAVDTAKDAAITALGAI